MNQDHDAITIDEIADMFQARLDDGESPTIEEYKSLYPQLADQIDAVLPAILMLEQMDSKPANPKLALDESIPNIVGEYEIIREIGRGGMGIVFEAKHVTMRRRVALKILPKHLGSKSNYLARFLTEARSAGKLHHSNIVPVFEVGNIGDIHFYAMQFINGENLDRIIADIKNIRDQSSTHFNSNRSQLALTQAGHSLKTDQVSDTDQRASSNSCNRLSDSSLHLHDPSTVVRSRMVYHRRVAAVGAQIAEALSYAHNHGVLHRDIKPANLILDTEGTAWVTDFGLAKIESDDLTRTGDIIGTIRYMAPERFHGKADRRSDIYGLGLTLFELCTLHYAFDHIDSAQLVNEIPNGLQRRPSSLDASIPVDLETIILKSLEVAPARRYQTAKDVADDLQLFLADRPIRARRTSSAERFWRMCRRNPALSTMAGCIALLLVALTFSSFNFAWRQARLTEAAVKSRNDFRTQLFSSKQDEARMRRLAKQRGQRFDSLAATRSARELLPELGLSDEEVEIERLKLRNDAIAALNLPDVETVRSMPLHGEWGSGLRVAFDSEHKTWAQGHPDGRLRIGAVESPHDSFTVFQSPGQPCQKVSLHGKGRFVAALYFKAGGLHKDTRLLVWDRQSPEKSIVNEAGVVDVSFAKNELKLAFSVENRVEIVDLANPNADRKVVKLEWATRSICLSNDGGQVVVSQRQGTKLQKWIVSEEPKLSWSTSINNGTTALDWDSERHMLLAGTSDGGLYLWNDDRANTNNSPVEAIYLESATQGSVAQIHIHPHLETVAISGFDSSVRFIDPNSLTESFRISQGTFLLSSGFGDNGQLAHIKQASHSIDVWQFAGPNLSTFPESPASSGSISFHPTFPELIVRSTPKEIEFWNCRSKRLLHSLKVKFNSGFQFSPDGTSLFHSGNEGLWRREFRIDRDTDGDIFVEELSATQLQSNSSNDLAIFGNGRLLVAFGFVICEVDPDSGAIIKHFERKGGFRRFSVTADNRFAIATTQLGKGANVWDVETGKVVHVFQPSEQGVSAIGNPRKFEQVFTVGNDVRIWTTASFELQSSIKFAGNAPQKLACFSNDGKLVAIALSASRIELMETHSFRSVATINVDPRNRILSFQFSPDDQRLAISCDSQLQLLNFLELRQRLEEAELNWK